MILDSLEWAKHPRSSYAAEAVVRGAKAGQTALAKILSCLVEAGVCNEKGDLLMVWNGHQFVRNSQ